MFQHSSIIAASAFFSAFFAPSNRRTPRCRRLQLLPKNSFSPAHLRARPDAAVSTREQRLPRQWGELAPSRCNARAHRQQAVEEVASRAPAGFLRGARASDRWIERHPALVQRPGRVVGIHHPTRHRRMRICCAAAIPRQHVCPDPPEVRMRAAALILLLICAVPPALAQAWSDGLRAELDASGIPPEAVGLYVQEVGAAAPLLAWNADKPMNPASAMKLVTTLAALELLGAAYTWRTEIYTDGPMHGDVLEGNLVLKGCGDPKLDLEKLWLLVEMLRGRGLREIRGDLVADRSAFALETSDPAQFDNAPTRPYNVQPDALLVNYKSIDLQFVPDEESGTVRIVSPPASCADQHRQRAHAGRGQLRGLAGTARRDRSSRRSSCSAACFRAAAARSTRASACSRPTPTCRRCSSSSGARRAERSRGACARDRSPRARACSPRGNHLRSRRSSATSTSGATT